MSATAVARYCEVDLKTVHNWVSRDVIPHFRTPGRHLRFRREDVVRFLTDYGYPVPDELRRPRLGFLLLEPDEAVRRQVEQALRHAVDLRMADDIVPAAFAMGQRAPDGVVIPAEQPRALAALRALPGGDVPFYVALYDDAKAGEEALAQGASKIAPRARPSELLQVIAGLIERSS